MRTNSFWLSFALTIVFGCAKPVPAPEPIFDPPPRPTPVDPNPKPNPQPNPAPIATDADYSKVLELKALVEAGTGSLADSDRLLGRRYSERTEFIEPFGFVVEYHAKDSAGTGKLNVYAHAKSKTDTRLVSLGVR